MKNKIWFNAVKSVTRHFLCCIIKKCSFIAQKSVLKNAKTNGAPNVANDMHTYLFFYVDHFTLTLKNMYISK